MKNVAELVTSALQKEYHIASQILAQMTQVERQSLYEALGGIKTIILLIEDAIEERGK